MSGGYTPVFNSALDGTLFGKWPHTGIWLCLLSQCDRHGNVDVVPGLLAAKIGVPLETLLECIADFMKPDPGSRTGDLEGRRLELIEPASRDWGWRVINHGVYRERARKQAYDAQRTASGIDAQRKRENRGSREVPTCPDASRALPLSDAEANADAEANSNSNSNSNLRGGEATRKKRAAGPATRIPDDFALTEDRRQYAVTKGVEPDSTFEAFVAFWRSKAKDNTKLDWNLTWYSWVLKEAKEARQRSAPRKSRFDQAMEHLNGH